MKQLSESELLKRYSIIVVEADNDQPIGDYSASQADGHADEFDNFAAPTTENEPMPEITEDPIADLSTYLLSKDDIENTANVDRYIREWLKNNGYELTPTGGLENKEGKV